jgi:SAM-dependent methyltransferase
MTQIPEQARALWARWAPHYTGIHGAHVEPELVDMLADLAGEGPALELGVGSGRIALPLAERGVPVVGVDLSPEMIAKLEELRGDLPITVSVSDMAAPAVTGPFPLIFVTMSTFFLLLTQERQVECFRNVARLLSPGGRFVIEVRAWPRTEQLIVRSVDDDGATITVQSHDPIAQIVRSQRISFDADGSCTMLPAASRYAYPAELDLMAQLANLTLETRYANWRKDPFHATSAYHVSLYRS